LKRARKKRAIIWKARLGMYRNQRALTFTQSDQLEKAVALFWSDELFMGMPRSYADGKTLVVPAEAVRLFKSQGLLFKEFEVISAGDLRMEQGTR
jgi:hypothetical protein